MSDIFWRLPIAAIIEKKISKHRSFHFHSGTYIGVHYHFGRKQWVALISQPPGYSTHYGWGKTRLEALKDLKKTRAEFVRERLQGRQADSEVLSHHLELQVGYLLATLERSSRDQVSE